MSCADAGCEIESSWVAEQPPVLAAGLSSFPPNAGFGLPCSAKSTCPDGVLDLGLGQACDYARGDWRLVPASFHVHTYSHVWDSLI